MRYLTKNATRIVVATKSVDEESMEVMPLKVELLHPYDISLKRIEKEAERTVKSLGFKLVKIEDITKERVQYRMPSEEFFKNAELVK